MSLLLLKNNTKIQLIIKREKEEQLPSGEIQLIIKREKEEQLPSGER